jgi:uncharacterized protein
MKFILFPKDQKILKIGIQIMSRWLFFIIFILSCQIFFATPNQDLINAFKNRNFDDVQNAIQKGADVNVKDSDGQSALNYAIKDNLDAVKFLIEKKADVNAKDEHGCTVLMTASNWGNLEIIKYLIKKGANIYAKDNEGWTVLMYACLSGKLEIVNYLVEQGLDVNVKNKDGRTALIETSTYVNNGLEIIKYLINKSAKVNVKDNEGKTALSEASLKGYKDVVEYLSGKNNSKWVTTEAGLRMRENPDFKSKKIDTIPYADEVKILQEKGKNITISGATGKWCKVEWKDKTGWVFGGFLNETVPNINSNITVNYFIGNWNDMDPDCIDGECGGNQYISFSKDGKCTIQQSGGGYNGGWEYDSKNKRLVLNLVYTDGNYGKKSETKTCYCKIIIQTENKMKLVNLSSEYPMLGVLYRGK